MHLIFFASYYRCREITSLLSKMQKFHRKIEARTFSAKRMKIGYFMRRYKNYVGRVAITQCRFRFEISQHCVRYKNRLLLLLLDLIAVLRK